MQRELANVFLVPKRCDEILRVEDVSPRLVGVERTKIRLESLAVKDRLVDDLAHIVADIGRQQLIA